MPLGIENHKDWRVDEQAELLKHYSSEYLGVSLDTGNNLSILDDPSETVEKLAPYTFNVHFKDMGVEETETGFLLSEVPLGEGFVDLAKVLTTLRRARPEIRFNLEMITRDPLKVPCLTAKYWATFERLPGKHLAQTLTLVRAHRPKQPLPRVSGMMNSRQLEVEEDNVKRSFAFAGKQLQL